MGWCRSMSDSLEISTTRYVTFYFGEKRSVSMSNISDEKLAELRENMRVGKTFSIVLNPKRADVVHTEYWVNPKQVTYVNVEEYRSDSDGIY